MLKELKLFSDFPETTNSIEGDRFKAFIVINGLK